MTDRILRAVTALLDRGRTLRKETRGLARQLRQLGETVDDEAAAKNKSQKDRKGELKKRSSEASKDIVDRLRDL